MLLLPALFNKVKQNVLCVTLTGILISRVSGWVKHIRAIQKDLLCTLWTVLPECIQVTLKKLFAECCCKACIDLLLFLRAKEIITFVFYLCHSLLTRGYEDGACLIHTVHKELWNDKKPDYYHNLFQVLLIHLLEFFFRILRFGFCCRLSFHNANSTQLELYQSQVLHELYVVSMLNHLSSIMCSHSAFSSFDCDVGTSCCPGIPYMIFLWSLPKPSGNSDQPYCPVCIVFTSSSTIACAFIFTLQHC